MTRGLEVSEDVFKQFSKDHSRLFINNKDGTFTESSLEYGIIHTGQGRGISCFDYDHDGDVDVLIANNGASPSLFRNNAKDNNNYLHVSLVGGIKNKEAVGAKITITIDGKQQLRQLRLGSNYLSNDPVIAYFGVGKSTKVDSLSIRWMDGTVKKLINVNVNQHLRIDKKGLMTKLY